MCCNGCNTILTICFELTKQIVEILKKTPLSAPLARSSRSFPRLRAFSGHTYYKTRAAFTFPARAAGMRQMGCAYRKARLSDAQEIVCIVHTFSFVLTKEKVVRKGEPCRALARKFARHTGGGFSPLRLVAPRRHGRRRAALAALTAAPAAPLSQKSRCAAIFGSPVYFQGSRLKNARRIHLHPYAHKGKEAKASFCLFLSICME